VYCGALSTQLQAFFSLLLLQSIALREWSSVYVYIAVFVKGKSPPGNHLYGEGKDVPIAYLLEPFLVFLDYLSKGELVF
jgi:hypothetical protein